VTGGEGRNSLNGYKAAATNTTYTNSGTKYSSTSIEAWVVRAAECFYLKMRWVTKPTSRRRCEIKTSSSTLTTPPGLCKSTWRSSRIQSTIYRYIRQTSSISTHIHRPHEHSRSKGIPPTEHTLTSLQNSSKDYLNQHMDSKLQNQVITASRCRSNRESGVVTIVRM